MGAGASATQALEGASFQDVRSAFQDLSEDEQMMVRQSVVADEVSSWYHLRQVLGLDSSPEITQEQWNESFGKISGGDTVITKGDWSKIKADPLIFRNISGSQDPSAVIAKTKWTMAFENAGQVQEEAQKLLRSLNLESALAEKLPKDSLLVPCMSDPLNGLFNLQEHHIAQMIKEASHVMADLIKQAIKDGRDARNAIEGNVGANRGSKFTGKLSGGMLDEFYKGVTGIVGEPHVNLKDGVFKEHIEKSDAETPFTTQNYGITTCPRIEYKFIAEYSDPGGDAITVPSIRRCISQDGAAQQDVRRVFPIEHFLELEVVKKVQLTWVEILAVVLYTGPLFVIYNGILRGSGFCGEVAAEVPFWSKDGEFRRQYESKTIEDRMEFAQHHFSSTIHCLASAVKKMQHVCSGVQGTWLYRGLGGLDIKEFLEGNGFAERAFTSTTKSLEVALEYSGAAKGLAGTVLAIELSEVDQGAVLQEFSQFPGEEEILWNACSYLEAREGREEWKMTKWGPVKLVSVKMNASGRALTVEELESRRKTIVVNMLETIDGDISHDLEVATTEEGFKKKWKSEGGHAYHKVKFIQYAETAITDVVDRYRRQPASWFHTNDRFLEAVEAAASLPQKADGWIECYIEDDTKHIRDAVEWKFLEADQDLRLLRQRRLEAARQRGDAAEVQRLAADLCVMKHFVQSPTAINEVRFKGSDETPLLMKCNEGDIEAVRLLLEAGAAIEAKKEALMGPLHVAALAGHADVLLVLFQAKADIQAEDQDKKTPLHHAGSGGVAMALLKANACIEAEDIKQRTPLYMASADGRIDTVETLLKARANVDSQDERHHMPLHEAAAEGKSELVLLLLQAHADLEVRDDKQQTPLHWAANSNRSEMVTTLLEARADIEAKAECQRTTLHLVAKKREKEMVKVLLEARADVEATDEDGMTAADLIVVQGLSHVLDVVGISNAEVTRIRTRARPSLPALPDLASGA